jgi:CheY-like chemotaxis protein
MARILLVEDDDSVRQFVKRALEIDGHAVITGDDGSEGLEILEGDKGRFDLLLSDITMPVMDGIALALSAARAFPKLAILLMTGYAEQRERAANVAEVVHDVVSKPFTLAEIRRAVDAALNGVPPPTSPRRLMTA